MTRHIVSVLVANNSGVLSRVSGLFSRRGYNIDSVSSGETEDPAVSRLTIVVRGDYNVLEQIEKQLNKLVDVIKVAALDEDSSVCRELLLVKVKAHEANRAAISEIVDIFRARIIDVASESLIVEITGAESKLTAFLDLMQKYDIREIARTGITALGRGNDALRDEVN